jgi:hypothetical protein
VPAVPPEVTTVLPNVGNAGTTPPVTVVERTVGVLSPPINVSEYEKLSPAVVIVNSPGV